MITNSKPSMLKSIEYRFPAPLTIKSRPPEDNLLSDQCCPVLDPMVEPVLHRHYTKADRSKALKTTTKNISNEAMQKKATKNKAANKKASESSTPMAMRSDPAATHSEDLEAKLDVLCREHMKSQVHIIHTHTHTHTHT